VLDMFARGRPTQAKRNGELVSLAEIWTATPLMVFLPRTRGTRRLVGKLFNKRPVEQAVRPVSRLR
jgi:hypothetical protein